MPLFPESMAKIKRKSKPPRAESIENATSPFVQHTTSLYLALSPCAYNFPIEGLCAEHLSPNLLSYYPPLEGVLLSYSNPRISEEPEAGVPNGRAATLSRSIDEYAVSYVWLTADFFVFRPEKGTELVGYVNLQAESVLGLMCYNYFNAAIESSKLPEDWRWDGEKWLMGSGIEVGGSIRFQVVDFESSGQDGISIMGSMRNG